MKPSEYFKRLACLAFDVDFNPDIPHMAKDFILKTMTLNPNDRMSAY
jgi:calcium/calmodulin-dependent protein kinase I